MAGKPKEIDIDKLWELAMEYCDFCMDSTKEVATVKGIVEIRERHLPTVSFFLCHWLRRNHFDFYKRSNWYDAMKDSTHPCSDTIKRIDEHFNALAADIVANEGKGIFYAKNKLGMTDKVEQKQEGGTISTLNINVNKSGLPPVSSEKDVKL